MKIVLTCLFVTLCLVVIMFYFLAFYQADELYLYRIHTSSPDKKVNNIHKKKLNNIPIYYINLERSPKRRKFMENQFEKYNLPYTRINAVDGKELLSLYIGDIDTNLRYENNYSNVNKPLLGCTLSHLKTILTAYQNGDEWALILEDDISLSLLPKWKKSLKKITKEAPYHWQILMLAPIFCWDASSSKKFIQHSDKKCWGAGSYIINRKGMKNMLKMVYKQYSDYGLFTINRGDKKIASLNTMVVADDFIFSCVPFSFYYVETPLFFQYNVRNKSTLHPFVESLNTIHIRRSFHLKKKRKK